MRELSFHLAVKLSCVCNCICLFGVCKQIDNILLVVLLLLFLLFYIVLFHLYTISFLSETVTIFKSTNTEEGIITGHVNKG